MTLARRLSIVIFGAAAIAALVLSFVVYSLGHDAVTNSAKQRQPELAKQLISSIDRLLNERRNDIITMSEDEEVIVAANQPSVAAKRAISSMRLRELSAVTGPWDNLSVVDRSGVVLASNPSAAAGASINDDADVVAIVHQAQAGEVVYSDLLIDKVSGKPTVMFAAPIRKENNPGNPVVATVVGSMSWSNVQEMLKLSMQPHASLFNHAGIEIANSTDQTSILKKDGNKSQAVKKGQSQINGTEIMPGLNTKEESIASYVFEPGYSDFKGNGWVLVLEMPTSLAFAPANETLLKLVLALFFMIAAGAGSAVFLVARAVQPVTQLTKSANRLAIGDLSHRFRVTTKDELGQLGTALNNMADKLQQLYQGLEGKVKEKTVRLALRAQEAEAGAAKDEAILSSIGEGLVVVNNDSRVTRINAQALEIFGVELQTVLGKKILENVQFSGERGEPLDDGSLPTQAALAKGERGIGTYLVKRGGTEKVLIAIISNPVKLKEQIVGAIMVVRDVTKEREVDRMKTEFISLASHQLRTPLSAIKWFTEMLVAGDAGPLNEEQHEFANNVYDSTQRMIELVNSLLNISRIESGRIIVDPHPTDVDKMVHGIVNDLKAKIEEKQQSLVVSVHEDLPKINLDARLIGQVYLNFLTNAIKYTPEGGEIVVTVSRKGEDLVTQVSDNGYGIPADQQDRVFQKFFRAENAVKVETDGTGLGLYLVKAIIESSGGKVWFESKENKGTTFWFSLPMSGMKAHEGEVTLDV